MKRLLATIVLALFIISNAAEAKDSCSQAAKMQMLSQVVRILPNGSGVIVDVKLKGEEISIHIATSYHVVSEFNIARESEDGRVYFEWNPVIVEWFRYDSRTRVVDTYKHSAELGRFDPLTDLALLVVRGTKKELPVWLLKNVAIFGSVDRLRIFDEVYAVGTPLGTMPLATRGEISSFNVQIGNQPIPHILHTALAYMGNSGGGIFICNKKKSRYEFIGINKNMHSGEVMLNVMGLSVLTSYPVTHLIYAIPGDMVHKFLGR